MAFEDDDEHGGFCGECGDDAVPGTGLCRHCARQHGEDGDGEDDFDRDYD